MSDLQKFGYSGGERVAVVTVTADEARFIAELIPSEDAAHGEWEWIAQQLEREIAEDGEDDDD